MKGGVCMNEIRELLAARKAELCKIQKNKEQALKTAPKGSLRISGHGDKMQYYHRCDPSGTAPGWAGVLSA